MIKSGTWVSIRCIILKANERTGSIPVDTAKTPLLMWIKGWLLEDSEIGQTAEIRTVTGRFESGVLEEALPSIPVNYGDFIPEVLEIGQSARKILLEVH